MIIGVPWHYLIRIYFVVWVIFENLHAYFLLCRSYKLNVSYQVDLDEHKREPDILKEKNVYLNEKMDIEICDGLSKEMSPLCNDCMVLWKTRNILLLLYLYIPQMTLSNWFLLGIVLITKIKAICLFTPSGLHRALSWRMLKMFVVILVSLYSVKINCSMLDITTLPWKIEFLENFC